MKLTRVGVDLAKQVFQVHGVDRAERPVWCQRLKRSRWIAELERHVEPGCEIGMEACGGAHHWARLLQSKGYVVKLIAPQFVKPYVKSNKNDANDARGDLRGDEPAEYALRSGQDGRAAGHPGGAPGSGKPDQRAHREGEPAARAGVRVRVSGAPRDRVAATGGTGLAGGRDERAECSVQGSARGALSRPARARRARPRA